MRSQARVSPEPALPVCEGCATCGDCTPWRLFGRTGWDEWLCLDCWRRAGELGYRAAGRPEERAAAEQLARAGRA